jgi:PIN domain nuclease of toxin-antitoxin system
VTFAFDSSALISVILDERGGEIAGPLLAEGVVSAVVLAETLGKLAARGFDPERTRTFFLATGLEVDAVTEADALAIAQLHELRRRNISLADRICLAHAMSREFELVTADRAWSGLGLAVKLRLIR